MRTALVMPEGKLMSSRSPFLCLVILMVLPMACSRKRDHKEGEPGLASHSAFESVAYSYFVHSSCDDTVVKTLVFNGDDVKDPIFARIAGTAKSTFERRNVCKTLVSADVPREIRLKITRFDGSSETLASLDLGCSQDVSPDVTGVTPDELLSEIHEALEPKVMESSSSFRQNKLAVYYGDERLKPLDLDSFEAFDSYARDNARVYFGNKVLDSADRNSFSSLTAGWAKDQTHAYFHGEIMAGADPGSLVVDKVQPDYAVDSKQVYYQGKMNTLVADVDAPSFEVDSCSKGPQARMLCSPPHPMGWKLVCQVHDRNRSFILEEAAGAIRSP